MKIVKSKIISAMLGVGVFFISLPVFDSLNPSKLPESERVLEVGAEQFYREIKKAMSINNINWERSVFVFWGVFIISNVFFYLRPDLLNRKDKSK